MNKLIAIVVVLALGFIGLVAYSYHYGGCVTDIEFSKNRVVAHLEKMGLPTKPLEFDSERTTSCRVSFIYSNTDKPVYFTVIDGGKVTWWDTNERGPL